MRLSIVTPETSAYDGPAAHVVVPGFDGEVAFLPGHAPFVGLLGAGELRCQLPDGAGLRRWYLAGGVVQVVGDEVSVLAETVSPVDALVAERAREELDRALAARGGDEAAEAARARAISDARAKLRLVERGSAG